VEKCAQDTAETAQPRICYRREAVTILGHGDRARIDLIGDCPVSGPPLIHSSKSSFRGLA
jgi:hypothetical protein